jgi:ABC-2 type transport system permease protein
MHPALLKLIVLSLKSAFRRAFRGVRTAKGAFLTVFTMGVLLMMIAPGVIAAVTMRGHPGMPQFSGWLAPYLPIMILGFCLLLIFGPAGEMAISFTPAEVDFLFPAPFHRRELLNYKLAKLFIGAVFGSLFCSMSALIYLNMWLSAFVGIFLTLAFTQLLGLSVALAGQIVAEHAYTTTRRLLLLGVGALVLTGLAQMFWQTPIGSIPDLAWSFRSTWTGRALLAPFEVFSHAILADAFFPDLVCWGTGAAAIDLGLLILVLKLDADYLEGAAAVSQKLYERMRLARKGGGLALPTSKTAARLRIPRLPWLAGAGPLAWRQLLLAMRTSRLVILISLGLGCVLLVMAFVMPSDNERPAILLPTMGLGFIGYLTFLFAMQLPWAFRGDIDHMDSLKALPVAPLALAAGELAGGVLVLAVIQFVVLAALLVAKGNPAVILTAAAYLIPFDTLMLGVSNILFLIYPVRMVQTNAADFQLMGRLMLLMLLQFLILIPSLGIPAATGGIVFWLSDFSWPAFAATSWLVLVAELPLILVLLAWVFQRFDPSTEMPA